MAAKKETNVQDAFASFDGVTITEELDGVWRPNVGSVIIGVISHAYGWETTKLGDDNQARTLPVYGLALRTECKVDAEQEGEIYPFDEGSLIGVTLGQKIEQAMFLRQGDKIALRFDGEVKLGGGRKVNRYSLKSDNALRQTPMMARITKKLPEYTQVDPPQAEPPSQAVIQATYDDAF